MKKALVAAGSALSLVLMVLAAVIAPDGLSLAVIGLMLALMAAGAFAGIFPVMSFTKGIATARKNIMKITEMQPNAPWLYVQQNDRLFSQKELDAMLRAYITCTRRELQEGRVSGDIEDFINEDSLGLRAWRGPVQMIPATLTAIGLAGTFVGLVLGISSIGFSSAEATIGSIEVLLGGIRTAFYTSIAGIVFSIIFNIYLRMTWHVMLRELGLFTEEFHLYVLPSSAEQARQKQEQDVRRVLSLLERLPAAAGFSITPQNVDRLSADIQNEQQLVADIQEGMQKGEFIFFVQPRCDLETHRIVGGEALMRWNHSRMGLVSPRAFLAVLEKNGFIAKLDRQIWEDVCRELRSWIDEGRRPLPMSINISKTDVMTIDIANTLSELVKKYRIAPRYIELEISSSAYLQCGTIIQKVERELRQKGFRVVADGFNGDFTGMNVLKDAEADAIKLDLCCMRYEEGGKREAIQAAFEQASALKIPMTAEGIESAEDLNLLRSCGFREGQGYHLYRPMAMEDFRRLAEEADK